MGCVFFFNATLYLKDFFVYQPKFYQSDYFLSLSLSIDAWMIAAWAIFLTELIRPGKTNLWTALSNSLPLVFISILFAVTGSQKVFDYSKIYYLFYGIVLYGYFLYHSRLYNKILRDNYSYYEGINIGWVYVILSLFTIYFIVWFFVNKRVDQMIDISYFLFSLAIWIIVVHKGYYQEAIILENKEEDLPDDFLEELQQVSKYPLTFEKKINQLIHEQQVFLDPKLTLPQLAAKINTNRTYLSNYLNSTLNMSFSSYINSFRLDYACKLLADPDNKDTLDVIAEKAGFNSPSTFRRVFIEKFNYPPKLYKRNNS